VTVVSTFAFNGSHEKSANLRNILACLDAAAAVGARLAVFPETSLQGYRTIRDRSADLLRVYDGAEPVPDGPSVRAIAERAQALGMLVAYGLNESGSRPGVVYNAAVLTGPNGHIGCYRKVHIGPSERAIWQEGDQWPVFETEIGRIGLLICYDKAWPESTRELMLGGADIFVMPTAWPRLPDQYDLLERARAVENHRWFISSNYAGPLGPTSYFGLSQVIDPCGNVIATSGQTTEQKMVTAEIEVRAGIETALAEFAGARLERDRRPGTYRRSMGVDVKS
jgi:predicted amidohydrolase